MTHSVLAAKAIEYKAMGIITLPVDRKSKRALIPYADLTLDDITEAYIDSNFGTQSKADGIAILNGEKSDILTLDIDISGIRAILGEEHPELLDTFTEKTPRKEDGYHLFYEIADSDKNLIQGRRWTGIDLLWKNYVITAPTEGYQVVEDKPIKILSLIDYLKLCTFFDKHLGIIEEAQNREAPRTSQDNKTSTQSSKVIIEQNKNLPEIRAMLEAVYNQQRKTLDRNNSLFYTLRYARDHLISIQDAVEALEYIFTSDKKYSAQFQSYHARLKELKATAKSAYSRPARPIREFSRVLSLSDNTREKLIQMGLTNVVRTLEGLYRAGYQVGDKTTRKEAEQLLKGIVGRDSIHAALDAIFPLSATYPPHTNVANNTCKKNTNKCVFVRGQKPVKTYKGVAIGGRPEYEYIIPSPEKMARLVGADDSKYSTPLTLSDLETAKKTRQKLHFSLIDRRPSTYDLIWLAKRLGLTETTIKTYNRELGIFSIPQFKETPLNRFNFEAVLEDLPDRQGIFIMDAFGKKYPPIIEIAQRLLTKRIACSLFIQGANYYTTRKPQIAPNLRPTHSKNIYAKRDAVQQKLASKEAPKQKKLPALDVPIIESSKPNEEIIAKPKTGYELHQQITKAIKKLDRLFNSGKLNESDWWEQKQALFFSMPATMSNWDYGEPKPCEIETWDGMTGIKPLKKPVSVPSVKQEIDTTPIRNLIQGLSERNTKRLIGLYGYKRVLYVSQFVSKRENVSNAAGLLTTILKSEEKAKELEQLL